MLIAALSTAPSMGCKSGFSMRLGLLVSPGEFAEGYTASATAVIRHTEPQPGITLNSALAAGVTGFLLSFRTWYATLGAAAPNTLLGYLRSGLGSDFNFSSTTSP